MRGQVTGVAPAAGEVGDRALRSKVAWSRRPNSSSGSSIRYWSVLPSGWNQVSRVDLDGPVKLSGISHRAAPFEHALSSARPDGNQAGSA
ncbi:hypothetical protein [Micromonospora sp. NPDC005806]|uniref:hypothetical protein n=1 Tax=Micromonospora sp. NPDC005806 TaxID=3364234 RepID=UPI0036D0A5AA